MHQRDLAVLIDRAYRSDLTDAEVAELLDSDEPQVAQALAANETLSPEALGRVVEGFPGLRALVAVNPSAAPALKEEAPIGSLPPVAIERYLDDVDATPEVRSAVLRAFDPAPAGGGPTLGEVRRSAQPG